jgi:hypothetical protein
VPEEEVADLEVFAAAAAAAATPLAVSDGAAAAMAVVSVRTRAGGAIEVDNLRHHRRQTI